MSKTVTLYTHYSHDQSAIEDMFACPHAGEPAQGIQKRVFGCMHVELGLVWRELESTISSISYQWPLGTLESTISS
jgi:hypothetical protein